MLLLGGKRLFGLLFVSTVYQLGWWNWDNIGRTILQILQTDRDGPLLGCSISHGVSSLNIRIDQPFTSYRIVGSFEHPFSRANIHTLNLPTSASAG